MKKVILGADKNDIIYSTVDGYRCGILTSASGTDSCGIPTYLKLHERGVLTAIFSPEHGLYSALQDGAWDGIYHDRETGIPVFSLKNITREQIDYALSLCDILIYDIQDVGARFYTYIYSLTYLMKECAIKKIPVIVLDRPNPISGNLSKIAGPLLDVDGCSSSIGKYNIPTRYSLTCGEFAKYINATEKIGCELLVITCENWERSMYWDETELLWINPSPNIPSINTAINYIGTCLIEATNASEGRGTTRPFELIGAPFFDGSKLCNRLNNLKLEGILFTKAFFNPMFGKWQGEICEGVQLNITDRSKYNPHYVGMHILSVLAEFKDFTINERSMSLRYGNNFLYADGFINPDKVYKKEQADRLLFLNKITEFLLYQ